MSKEEEYLLIKSFINGDTGAFDKLIIKYKKIVINLCNKIFNNYEDAEDCSQEVFIIVFNALKNFQFKSTLKTWIYTITLNVCRNKIKTAEYRYQKNKISLNNEFNTLKNPLEILIVDNTYSPYNYLWNKYSDIFILKMINSLPDKYRFLLLLKDIDDKSYEEIITITGFKSSTIRSILSRARKKLKAKLLSVA